jgi:very-long-chain (3R)-3-hydroxyacyl-CoA dehydratase
MSTKPKSSSAYLLAYNFVSAALWLTVLGRVVLVSKDNGGALKAAETGKVYQNLESYARLVQTGALLEVVHSLVGELASPFHSYFSSSARCEVEIVWKR